MKLTDTAVRNAKAKDKVNEIFAGDLSDNDKVDFAISVVNKVLESGELRIQANGVRLQG